MFTPDNPLFIGITGLPRVGKSTFTRLLPEVTGLDVAVVEGSEYIRNNYFDGRSNITRLEFAEKTEAIGSKRLNKEFFEYADSLKAPIKCMSGIRLFHAYTEITKRKGVFVVMTSDNAVRINRPAVKIEDKNLTIDEMLQKDYEGRELIIHALTNIADYRLPNNGTEEDLKENMRFMWDLINQGKIPFRLTLPY